MKSAQVWLQEYATTHQNPVNVRLHTICVPLIYWSIFAILWTIPAPAFFDQFRYLNWATLGMGLCLLFYLTLGLRYFFAMFVTSTLVFFSILELAAMDLPIVWIGGSIFIVAWIGQFYGHHAEGKKPAFFQDLLFLLIGPLWILHKTKLL